MSKLLRPEVAADRRADGVPPGHRARSATPHRKRRSGGPGRRPRDSLRHKADPFSLPPRNPQLNPIERVWLSAKYEDYPQRSHTSTDAIAAAIDQALTKQRNRIQRSAPNFVRTA